MKKIFQRFFKINTKKEKTVQSNVYNKDLFKELFPMTEENKTKFVIQLNSIFEKIFGREQTKELLKYSRNYSKKTTQLDDLTFDSMNWELISSTKSTLKYQSADGDVMVVDIIDPIEKMEEQHSQAIMLAYRDWIRNQTAQIGGGLIMCEEILTEEGIRGYESITKVPEKEAGGMNYAYFLNLNNYEKQKMYQFRVMVFEMNPTGIRDNISIHPICEITGIEIEELMKLYRQDPYDKEYQKGNLMNLSERKEFDEFFLFHPLSIIRNEIRPIILESIKFK